MMGVTDPGLKRGAAVAARLGLILMAGALVLYAIDQRTIVDVANSLWMPGSEPDTGGPEALSLLAAIEVITSLVIAARTSPSGGRAINTIAAGWAVLAMVTGALIASGTTTVLPQYDLIALGPLGVSKVLVGIALAVGCVVVLLASSVAWVAASPTRHADGPPIPPQIHQA